MNEQLLLENIRGVLMRLEETIIFALIERAQFCANPCVYEPGRFGAATEGESLAGYLLRETEKVHARIRRYTSPDEHPFFTVLPDPILPPLRFDESPLAGPTINHNAPLRRCYEQEMIPFLCRAGDDSQYGSSAVCDVACLQALSRRIHYGMFVAESKFREDPARFSPVIRAGDGASLLRMITHVDVEERVLKRVHTKACTYGQDPGGTSGRRKVEAESVMELYRRWIMPMTKTVEVEYLLHHPLV